ncbi:MAG TPA: hypothetical protein DCS20_04520 [Candidatus Yonathbacteria bacterium]|nr:hypothetical protein [Candidatus Yonathbacteria bacterium]
MFAKVLSNMAMPVICIILAIFFVFSVKSLFSLPTVYRSGVTEKCVRATDDHGRKMSCEKAQKGKYREVWI